MLSSPPTLACVQLACSLRAWCSPHSQEGHPQTQTWAKLGNIVCQCFPLLATMGTAPQLVRCVQKGDARSGQPGHHAETVSEDKDKRGVEQFWFTNILH